MKYRKPRKIPKAERTASELHQRIAHERSQTTARQRESRLRSKMAAVKITARMSRALAKAQELEVAVNIGDDEKSEAQR
jgi:hypothetical protein